MWPLARYPAVATSAGAGRALGTSWGTCLSGRGWTSHEDTGVRFAPFLAVSWGRNYSCGIPELEEDLSSSSVTDGETEAKQDMTGLSQRLLVVELGLSLLDGVRARPLASIPGGCVLRLKLATRPPPLAAFVPSNWEEGLTGEVSCPHRESGWKHSPIPTKPDPSPSTSHAWLSRGKRPVEHPASLLPTQRRVAVNELSNHHPCLPTQAIHSATLGRWRGGVRLMPRPKTRAVLATTVLEEPGDLDVVSELPWKVEESSRLALRRQPCPGAPTQPH